MMLHLKHRPRDWSGYVESSPDVGKFRKTLESGRFNGGALLIQGPSSSGKTTLAEIIVHALADDHTDINGANCTVDKVREIASGFAFKPMFGNEWRAIVVNECQSMTDKSVECWLDVLDHLPPKWVIVFTTTEDCRKLFAEFGEAFTSRCKRIVLQRPAEADAVCRLRAIADAEKIEATDWQLAELLKREGRNLRACIQKLEDADLPEPPKPEPAPEPPAPGAKPTPSPPVRPAEELERERLAIDAERQRRIAERVAQATAEPEPIKPIKPVAATPPMSAGALVDALKLHGTKVTLRQAETLLAACGGSIESLESLVKLPLRTKPSAEPDKSDTVVRGGMDNRKRKGQPKRVEPTEEPDDSRPTSDPSTWRIVAPLCVLLWFAWPWVALSAEFAVWAVRTVVSIWIYFDK